MDIQFQKSDAEYYKIEQLRREIAKIVCKNIPYIEIVATVLLEINIASSDLKNELSKLMELHKYKIEKAEWVEYRELENKLIEYYACVHDPEFDSNLKKRNPREYHSYKLSGNQEKINLFRGVLFESIVEEMVCGRFSKGKFETGCCIIINGNKVVISYGNGKRKETFDIAGWNHSDLWGEFYECKIRPNKFKKENYELMLCLEKYLVENKITNYKIIIVSADAEANVVNQIKELECNNLFKLDKYECYGKDSIQNIREIGMPIFA